MANAINTLGNMGTRPGAPNQASQHGGYQTRKESNGGGEEKNPGEVQTAPKEKEGRTCDASYRNHPALADAGQRVSDRLQGRQGFDAQEFRRRAIKSKREAGGNQAEKEHDAKRQPAGFGRGWRVAHGGIAGGAE